MGQPGRVDHEMDEQHHHHLGSHRSNNFPVVVSPSTPTSIPPSSIPTPLHLSTPQRTVNVINSPSPSQYQSINGPSPDTIASQDSAVRRHSQPPSRNKTTRSPSNNHGLNSNISHNRAVNDQQHASPPSASVATTGMLNKPRARSLIAEFELKRRREDEWLETVLRQRNVLLVTYLPHQCMLLTHPMNIHLSTHYNLSLNILSIYRIILQGMSQCESQEVKENDEDDSQSMNNITMSLLLADDQETTQDVGLVVSDRLLDATTLNLGEEEMTQVLRGDEEDGQSTVYGSSSILLGESSQRPSAVDMTTIYPTAVDHYHQPSVRNSSSDSNSSSNSYNNVNVNSNSNSGVSTHGADPTTNSLPIGTLSSGAHSRVVTVTVVAKEVHSSLVTSSPARLIDRDPIQVHVLPSTTAIATNNNSNNNNTTINNNDAMMKDDERILREAVDVYQRQALQDRADIQALKQERDALLSAASSSSSSRQVSSFHVQTRGAQMFSPTSTWTPNVNPHSHNTTPILNTTPVLDGTPFWKGATGGMQYDGPPIQSIQKVLTTTATAVTAIATPIASTASNQYVQRIQELEEKLRLEAEQTAVILSQRDTFAMSKSSLTAKLAGNCNCSLLLLNYAVIIH